MATHLRCSKLQRTNSGTLSSPAVSATATRGVGDSSVENPNKKIFLDRSKKKEKDDLLIRYYFDEAANQEDRNFVERALRIFGLRTTRARLLSMEEVVDNMIAQSAVHGFSVMAVRMMHLACQCAL